MVICDTLVYLHGYMLYIVVCISMVICDIYWCVLAWLYVIYWYVFAWLYVVDSGVHLHGYFVIHWYVFAWL